VPENKESGGRAQRLQITTALPADKKENFLVIAADA
jgi:hypothetical protein